MQRPRERGELRHAFLASGANIATFNVGDAGGAWVSGLALAAGFGCTSPLWVGAGVTLPGLIVLLVAAFAPGGEFARRRAARIVPVTETAAHGTREPVGV